MENEGGAGSMGIWAQHRYAPPLSCARTHHETRGQVVAKSSSPWVVYLSNSVTGNCDGPLSKAPRSSHLFSTQTPLPSNYCLVRMDFGATTPVLFYSRSSCSKIHGGRLRDPGDNEDHKRRQIVSEEPLYLRDI